MTLNAPSSDYSGPHDHTATPERPTETKPALKTIELITYIATVIAVLIASNAVGDTTGRADPFLADQAWLYVTLLTIGYMISRGLAKAGSTHHNDSSAR